MNAPPPELGLPIACPECGGPWVGFGSTSGTVSLFCDENHLLKQSANADEVRAFDLTMYPDRNLAKEVWLVGAKEPWPRMPPLPPHAAQPGFRLNVNDKPFVVVSVEERRVWLQPVTSSDLPV